MIFTQIQKIADNVNFVVANFFDTLINLSGNAILLQTITPFLFCLKYYIVFETKSLDMVLVA